VKTVGEENTFDKVTRGLYHAINQEIPSVNLAVSACDLGLGRKERIRQ
jgi:hypothetical protein